MLARGTNYVGARAVWSVTSYVRVNVCTLGPLPTEAYPAHWLESADVNEQEKHKVKLHPLGDSHFPVTFVSVFMIISNPRENGLVGARSSEYIGKDLLTGSTDT